MSLTSAHRADVKDIDGVNADKLFEAMEIEFENIMVDSM